MRALYEQMAKPGSFLSPQRGWADNTATTMPERWRRWAEPSQVSPRPTNGSAWKLWSRRSISRRPKSGRDRRNSDPGNIVRSRCGRDRLPRRATLDRRTARATRRGRPARPHAGQKHRIPDHGRSGQYRLGHHRRSGSRSGGTFYLLDLVPEPTPDNPDLQRFATDKENLKRDLFARIQARGERATPALVEKELPRWSGRKLRSSAIDAVRAAGGTPHYFSVNLADERLSPRSSSKCASGSGRIDVLLHAAGIERSQAYPKRSPANSIWCSTSRATACSTCCTPLGKCRWARRLRSVRLPDASATPDRPTTVRPTTCSCKITSSFRTTRPATRGIAIDWTAWGGIGMATRGSIPKMMEAGRNRHAAAGSGRSA